VPVQCLTLFDLYRNRELYCPEHCCESINDIIPCVYQDDIAQQSSGLLEVNSNGNAVMRVETTSKVSNTRNSVRITTKHQYSGGLIIMDSIHMPTGCGTWP